MTEWKEYKLGEIIQIVGGGTPKTSEPKYWNGNIPWLSVVDFNNGNKFVIDTEKHITQEGLENSSTKLLKKGDIIISARGTVGAIAMLGREMAFNQSCYGIRNSELIDNHYLFYSLKKSINELKQNSHGGVFDTITRETFNTINISLPPLPEQIRIASILSSLDDKIDLLHRENKTLEAMAETLFRQWFIEEAKEDWEEVSLEDIVYLSAGGDKPKNVSSNRTNELNIPIYSNGIEDEGLYGYTDIPKITEESVTISARGTIGYVVLRTEPFVPIVRLITLTPKKNITSKYLYFWAKSQDINGTGTTQQQLTIPDFKLTKVLLPEKELISKFTNEVDKYYEKILLNKKQIQTLIQKRDSLLPKLMSGEVKI